MSGRNDESGGAPKNFSTEILKKLREKLEELDRRTPPQLRILVNDMRRRLGIPASSLEAELLSALRGIEWPLTIDELWRELVRRGLNLSLREVEGAVFGLARAGVLRVEKGLVALSSFASLGGARKILELLKERRVVTIEELSRELGVHRDKIMAVLSDLSRAGIVSVSSGRVVLVS